MNGLRIAMWSGPRNISTAMMRAFENRGDCVVSDEPLYAHYLQQTGADHPAREAIIAAGQTDWRQVVAELTGPIPQSQALWYQKHMCHHLLPGMALDWIDDLHNVLLIRDPAAVVASYQRARGTVSLEEIGLPQQAELYARLSRRDGQPPLIIDADEFLLDPAAQLRRLCSALGIAFSERMLSWPAGPRDSDGVWAPHWYAAVWKSTGFASPRQPASDAPALNAQAQQVVDQALPIYRQLHAERLRSAAGD